MRERASPSEGVEGLVEMEMRLYGGLAAVVYLRTFGRCAENAGKCLTYGRWEGVWRRSGRSRRRKWKVGGERKCFVFLGTFQENVRYYGKIQG